jgi:ubiquinone/menaquinone biosynthesis C-methylase UbiE
LTTLFPKLNSENYHLREIKNLFNAKAATWNEKYKPGGTLDFRVASFERLLAERLPPHSTILDLGCGTAAVASALSARGLQVTACDIAEEMIDAGKRIYRESAIEWCLLPSHWTRLPFDDSTFDAIVASSVLEYVLDVNAVLIECHRILKPAGILVATVPDNRSLTRKWEKVIQPAAAWFAYLPDLNRIPKIHSYIVYLRCSRNRMALQEWVAIGQRAQFKVTEESGAGKTPGPLAFLTFRKTIKDAE